MRARRRHDDRGASPPCWRFRQDSDCPRRLDHELVRHDVYRSDHKRRRHEELQLHVQACKSGYETQEVGIKRHQRIHLQPNETRRRDAFAGAAFRRILRKHVEDGELLLGAPLPELAPE